MFENVCKILRKNSSGLQKQLIIRRPHYFQADLRCQTEAIGTKWPRRHYWHLKEKTLSFLAREDYNRLPKPRKREKILVYPTNENGTLTPEVLDVKPAQDFESEFMQMFKLQCRRRGKNQI